MPADRLQFGDFELDRPGYELRRLGAPVRMERIPMELLFVLAENPGCLIQRKTLVERVWGRAHFLEEDGALNTAVRKLRQALGDDAEKPRFIETVSGKGYRFMAAAVKATEPELPPARELKAGADNHRILVVVFPFQPLSKDASESYISDGITDELISCLAEASPSQLGVIGRITATECHRRGMTVGEIGRELGAQFVIEGTVNGWHKRVRITVRIVQVSDQVGVWVRGYEREIGDLLAWHCEVAREIAAEVKIAIPVGSSALAARKRRVEPLAYEYYLKGLHWWNKRTPPGCVQAIALLQRAIDIDPTYPLPYTGLAHAFILLAIHGARSPQDAYPKARAAATRALEIDPTLAEAHAALADVSKGFDWDWNRAEAGYKEAIRLNPSYGLTHQWYANFLSIRERHQEAIREAEEARRHDPLCAPAAGFVAFTLYRARRFHEALQEAARAADLNQPSAVVSWFRGLIHLHLADYTAAQDALETAVKESGDGAMFLATLAHVWGRAGKRDAAVKAARTLEGRSAGTYISPLDMCIAYAGFDRHTALDWLERAVQEHVMRVTELGMPLFDDLRSEPRFKRALQALR
jgi:TolB-like protein/Tfp pilus assembly protein PilF